MLYRPSRVDVDSYLCDLADVCDGELSLLCQQLAEAECVTPAQWAELISGLQASVVACESGVQPGDMIDVYTAALVECRNFEYFDVKDCDCED